MDTHTTSDIAKRLIETRDELAATAHALSAIPAQKEALLGARMLDLKSLSTVEEEESSLLRKQEYLRARVPLLAAQVEHEAATRAQARIGQLVSESAECSREYDRLLQEFHTAAQHLKQASEALIAGFRAVQSCHDEQEYLLLRFEAAHLTPATLTFSQERMPHEDDQADAVFKPLADFWQRQHSLAARNQWSRRRHELENARHYEQQRHAKQTIPGHLAHVR